MPLQRFLSAVQAAAAIHAPKYGLTPDELARAVITAAGLEGGLGEEAATGDNGKSVGRFQYYTNGGHGSTLLEQGYTIEQIADDVFQANDWTPVIASHLAAAKKNYSGPEAVRQAIYAAERPAQIYGAERFNSVWQAAGGTGTSGGAGMASSDWETRYAAKYARWDALDRKVRAYGDENTFYKKGQGLFGKEPVLNQYGQPTYKEVLLLTDAEWAEWDSLSSDLDDLEAEWETGGGSEDVNDAIARATFSYNTDPRNIDAENDAANYARELEARSQAVSLANNNIREQNQVQSEAEDSFNTAMTGSNRWGSVFRAPRTKLKSNSEMYTDAVIDVKNGMPNVRPKPYYTGPGLPSPSSRRTPEEVRGSVSSGTVAGTVDQHGNVWNAKGGYWQNAKGEIWQNDGSPYGKWYPSAKDVPAIEPGMPGYKKDPQISGTVLPTPWRT